MCATETGVGRLWDDEREFGDLEIWGFGDLGNLAILGFGDLGFGDLEIWDLEIWRFGDLEIWLSG
jgi:hypothetical protein